MSETTERVLIQVRLPRDLVRMLDHARIDLDLNRQECIEHLLRQALIAAGHRAAQEGTR